MSNTRSKPAARQHLRLVLPVAALLAAILTGCGKSQEIDPEKTTALIQPVARVELKTAEPAAETGGEAAPAAAAEAPASGDAPAASAGRSGEEVYKTACTVCHAVGVAGAPKTGNAEDWAPRIEKGLDANVASVISGLGAMPPRGGSNATDNEIRHAVIYLLNSGGGNF